jgi:hypothetical protein
METICRCEQFVSTSYMNRPPEFPAVFSYAINANENWFG